MRPSLLPLCLALSACIAEHRPIAPDDDAAADAGWPGLLAPPGLLVEPAALDFGAVEPGTSATRTLRLVNDGRSTLTLQAVTLEGSPGFSVTLDGVDVIAHPDVLLNPDGVGGEGLSRGAGVELQVTLRADAPGPYAADLVILAADLPATVVPLVGGPCLVASPAQVDFGVVPTGEGADRAVVLRTCDGESVEITSAYFAEGTSPAFGLVDVADARAALRFVPRQAQRYAGTLALEAADLGRVEVPLAGGGLAPTCPVAAVAADVVRAQPLDVVTLAALGEAAAWRWTLVERPAGSTTRPAEVYPDPRRPLDGAEADDPSTPEVALFVDLAGRYVLEVEALDGSGLVAPSADCPQAPARVTIEAWPDEALHIELTWVTPADPDPSDENGADLDLHLRHPDAAEWGQPPLDCYYANSSPDWGPPGPPGNPVLDIDAVHGEGPEHISLAEPELGGSYRIGVDYYREERYPSGHFGVSEATVRVYLGGDLAAELTRAMVATHDFWEVAAVAWTPDGPRVEVIDAYLPASP